MIEPDEVIAATGYTRPHTVHCMPGDNIVVAMLGDADGNGSGGFAVIDAKTFEVKGRWENGGATPPLNYDFWYQPRKNILVSSEFGEPNAYEPGFDLADVGAGRYGQRIHFWDLERADAGADGRPRREGARAARDPLAARPRRRAGLRRRGALERDVALPPRERLVGGRPGDRGRERRARGLAVPRSGADHRPRRSRWTTGSSTSRTGCTATSASTTSPTPAKPKLTGQLWLGGVLGKPSDAGRELNGGPKMLQLSFDGRRLYVTNSLYSTWDNQFYPELRSWLLRIDCDPNGGMEVDPDFFVDFPDRPAGRPARTRCASRAATARRRSSSDRRATSGDPGRGEPPPARAGRCGDAHGGSRRRPGRGRPPETPAPARENAQDVSEPAAKTTARSAAEEALLDAAERLLVDIGYAGITTRRLAEEAGVNHGLVHYYFGSIENLLVRALERFTERLIARQRELYAADMPFVEKWRTAMRYLVAEDRTYEKVWSSCRRWPGTTPGCGSGSPASTASGGRC